MDSLLNVIRVIIDVLPGRCKTINSASLSLHTLPYNSLLGCAVFYRFPLSHSPTHTHTHTLSPSTRCTNGCNTGLLKVLCTHAMLRERSKNVLTTYATTLMSVQLYTFHPHLCLDFISIFLPQQVSIFYVYISTAHMCVPLSLSFALSLSPTHIHTVMDEFIYSKTADKS